MAYDYETEKPWLFTDEGQRAVFAANENARKLLDSAGAFLGMRALNGVSIGDTWKMMAVLDRLVELGAIVEITGPNVWGQDRVFTRAR